MPKIEEIFFHGQDALQDFWKALYSTAVAYSIVLVYTTLYYNDFGDTNVQTSVFRDLGATRTL